MGVTMQCWKISGRMVVLASVLMEQGCWFKKAPPKASIVIPPSPQPPPPKPLPTPPQLPLPDTKATEAAEHVEVPTLPPPVEAPRPVKPKPVRRAGPASTTPPAEQSPAPAQETPTVTLTPSPGPSLQPILGQRETEERQRRIQQYLEKARLIVLRAERSNPDGKQKELIAQVRTFLQQAEDARKVDLARAENLAERAEVLSRGLAR